MAEADTSAFWDERYASGETPWDYGGVPPELSDYIAKQPPFRSILVPGCGRGHEVEAFAKMGCTVTAIDISGVAIRALRRRLRPYPQAKSLEGDFFERDLPEGGFDAVYERTFLCALAPDRRREYARRMHALLKPGGWLFGYFYYGTNEDPPPYPLAKGEEKTLFMADFDLIQNVPAEKPLAIFEGGEHWQIWRKRAKGLMGPGAQNVFG